MQQTAQIVLRIPQALRDKLEVVCRQKSIETNTFKINLSEIIREALELGSEILEKKYNVK